MNPCLQFKSQNPLILWSGALKQCCRSWIREQVLVRKIFKLSLGIMRKGEGEEALSGMNSATRSSCHRAACRHWPPTPSGRFSTVARSCLRGCGQAAAVDLSCLALTFITQSRWRSFSFSPPQVGSRSMDKFATVDAPPSNSSRS